MYYVSYIREYPIYEPAEGGYYYAGEHVESCREFSTWKKVKAVADKTGIPMDEREFHCKGEFKGVHKGKPDETDLNAAAEFARKIVKDPAGY